MNALTMVFVIGTFFFMLISVILLFIAIKGVGLKNMFTFCKVKLRARKGWGVIEILHPTGYRDWEPYKFDGKEIKLKKHEGRYIFKQHCMGNGIFGVPTISYRINDADPINPKTGLTSITPPNALESIITRSIKAEQVSGSPMEEFIKKNWIKIGIAILILVGGLLFVIMEQSGTISQLAMEASRSVVISPDMVENGQ